MKNTTQMLDAIYKVFIKDMEAMNLDELRAELSHYIEKDIYNMDSEDVRYTYKLLTEMGEV
jgi:hypothetical protein